MLEEGGAGESSIPRRTARPDLRGGSGIPAVSRQPPLTLTPPARRQDAPATSRSPEHLANPLIRKLDRLVPIGDTEKDILLGACSRLRSYRAGEDIVKEGDRPSDCNVLLEGMICRYKILPDGKRQISSFQVPGDIFDAQSFLLERMDHSIGALVACKVAPIPHQRLLEITETYPRIARAVWKDTLVDSSMFREWMTSIGRRSAYARIAHLMCEIFTRLRVVGLADGARIGWPITQSEIADALGLSNVHVNRTLQELRTDGLITLTRSTLIIEDWDNLADAGQFDPTYLHLGVRGGPAGARRTSGAAER